MLPIAVITSSLSVEANASPVYKYKIKCHKRIIYLLLTIMHLNRVSLVHLPALVLPHELPPTIIYSVRAEGSTTTAKWLQKLACIYTGSEGGWLWCDGCRWFGTVCSGGLLLRHAAQYAVDGS